MTIQTKNPVTEIYELMAVCDKIGVTIVRYTPGSMGGAECAAVFTADADDLIGLVEEHGITGARVQFLEGEKDVVYWPHLHDEATHQETVH